MFQQITQKFHGVNSVDVLNGRELRRGDILLVQWPNLAVTEEICQIMFRTWEDSRAYINLDRNGVILRIVLTEFGLPCKFKTE